ncbi:DUF1697 domain-containing protein [Microbacterium lemovicicum]|uniref:DUF1697 domain-containing protein n=1 Tax=Microbacterium lemovicicum TaxID=1072463 RepID=UPI00362B5758
MSTTWVALLRGVNVGGVTVRSADLAAMFRDLGHAEVRTFLASGNVRFETDDAPSRRSALKASIEKALRERFGYDAWIVLLTRAELENAVTAFPFDADDDGRQPYVLFSSDAAVLAELAEAAASLSDTETDPVAEGKGVLYWSPPKGRTLDTPFAKVIGRARYKSTTTNRNLRTLVKITA